MVLLNGRDEFPVYSLDTAEMRFRRCALMMKTSPLFLSTQPTDLSDLEDEKTNIRAVNLYTLIVRDAQRDESNFEAFFTQNREMLSKIPPRVVLNIWLRNLTSGYEEMKLFLEVDLLTQFISMPEFSDIGVADLDKIYSEAQYDPLPGIEAFLEEQAEAEANIGNFTQVVPVEMDHLETERINFEVPFPFEGDLVEIFDRFRVSEMLPYVNNGPSRHKVHRNFTQLEEEWVQGVEETVQFYVFNRKVLLSKFNSKNYSEGTIVMGKKGEAILAIETIVGAFNNRDEVLERIFSALGSGFDKRKIEQRSIDSVVNIPKQRFNKFIFNDLIFLNPILQDLCFISETTRVGKKLFSFSYQPSGTEKKITIKLTETDVETKDQRKNKILYPLNTRYVRVRINRAQNERTAREVAEFVGRVFTLYNQHHSEITSEYTQFIPTFVELPPVAVKHNLGKEKSLHDLLPSVFLPGYARQCQKPPLIVDELVKGKEARARNYVLHGVDPYTQVLQFPREEEEGEQHWYACPNSKYPYPGLRKNILENSEQYPYVPCCYTRDQVEKKNFREYYLGYKIEEARTAFSHILKTPKFLSKGELGTVPANLSTLFESFIATSAKNVIFYRTGVPRSPTSFLDAVGTALGRSVNPQDLPRFLSSCRQNAYSQTTVQLQAILNSGAYLNPSLFYRAVEEFCGCYIYIFTRSEDGNGTIVLPPHQHVYYRYSRERRPIVLVLEHLGSESDAAEYPQCEPILFVEEKKNHFNYSAEFGAQVDTLFRTSVEWHAGTHNVTDIDPSVILPGTMAQGIDVLGKTRFLVVKYKNKELYVLTDPLPPLILPERAQTKNNEVEVCEEFIRDLGFTVVGITPDSYVVTRRGFRYSLPYAISTTSEMGTYNYAQKVARYLQEYTYWLYSRWCDQKKLEISTENTNTFAREQFVVNPEYRYPKIPRKFGLKSGYMSREKLIVPSLETAQRLVFSLDLLIVRDPQRTRQYREQDLIQDYYLDRNDFVQSEDALIFTSDRSVLEWLEGDTNEHLLHLTPPSENPKVVPKGEEKKWTKMKLDELKKLCQSQGLKISGSRELLISRLQNPGLPENQAEEKKGVPTFYLKIREEVFLVQPAVSFDNAVFLAAFWNKYGYAIRSSEEDQESGYMYYVFESPDQVRTEGESANKVVVWNEGGEMKYAALLR